ncbi:MAG TPA: hypothetical protein VNP04_04480 [Alphaproteobacteria bacterium]|nr:hypothetical protein [Alphaproteobacteria bacterium]
MILETLLSAALEAGLGLLAEAGFDDEIGGLQDRLFKTTERQRREALECALARAREAVGDNAITPPLEHRPFLNEVVQALLDPNEPLDLEAVTQDWQVRLSTHRQALEKFFEALEQQLLLDDIWGPIPEHFRRKRFQRDVIQALRAHNLEHSSRELVHRVSAHLSGSGAIGLWGGVAAGAGGVAVGGNVGQIMRHRP